MRTIMDAFISAVEDARKQLAQSEGEAVSVRELIRRAGFPENERSKVAYHLNAKVKRPRGHSVPPEIVTRLASVLPISEAELMKAAQVAAGYQVVSQAGDDLGFEVARFLNSDDVTESEKQALTARLAEIVASQVRRSVSGS